MNGTPYSDTLDLAHATGDLYDLDPSDVVVMVRKALSEGSAGDSDPDAVFQYVMDDYMDHVTERVMADVGEYFTAEDTAIHESARRGMVRNLGITEDELVAAEDAYGAGNRGPLLKLRTAYMESM